MDECIFEYEKNETGLTLKKFISGGETIDVPAKASIEGETELPVTCIGAECFKENGIMITEIRVPDTVRVLEHDAFAYCVSLEKLMLPETISFIGADYLIASGLETAYIPAGVTQIERPELIDRRFEVAAGNKYYSSDGFGLYREDENGKLLIAVNASDTRAEYEIAKGTVGIATKALQDIATLKRLIIPDSLELINEGSFSFTGGKASGSTGIEEINVSPDNKKFLIKCDSLCERMADGTFKLIRYFGGEECRLEPDVKVIGAGAFKNSGLKRIHFPDTDIKIGDGAFSGCLLSYAYIDPGELFFGEEDQFTTEKFVLCFGKDGKLYDYTFLDEFLANEYLTEPRVRMIVSRLKNPRELSADLRYILRGRLEENTEEVIRLLAFEHNVAPLEDMGELEVFSESVVNEMIELTGTLGEKEMTAWFMTYKNKRYGVKDDLEFL